MNHLSKEDIQSAIKKYENEKVKRGKESFLHTTIENFQRAAVVIPLLKTEGEWHLLLTKRSETLLDHTGQVAFPGGAYEKRDNGLHETALREMDEEIGIKPADANLFGHLGDLPIVTGYLVRMYVAQIPWPYPLKISREEVDSTFIMPLNWLAERGNRWVEKRIFAGREIPVVFFKRYQGYQLWGASADMTLMLLSALNLNH